METIRTVFANNLRYYLSQTGMTQKDLCEKIGESPMIVNSWCTGKKAPRLDKYESLCHALNIDIWQLFDRNRAQFNAVTSPTERYLLSTFSALNAIGREKALSYITDLSEQEKYQNEEKTIKADLPWH